MKKGALISECGRYRYRLWRIWDETKPFVLFIMHNPSTADGEQDDPTIRRCINFAKDWGYGGIYVGNLYPYRATDPAVLRKLRYDEAWTFDNPIHINEMKRLCALHVLAYGNPAISGTEAYAWDDCWHYLKLTKAGNPCHPLYLSKSLKPQRINF